MGKASFLSPCTDVPAEDLPVAYRSNRVFELISLALYKCISDTQKRYFASKHAGQCNAVVVCCFLALLVKPKTSSAEFASLFGRAGNPWVATCQLDTMLRGLQLNDADCGLQPDGEIAAGLAAALL